VPVAPTTKQLQNIIGGGPSAQPNAQVGAKKPQSMVINEGEETELESLKAAVRKKNVEGRFLEQENMNLRERLRDLDKSISINKEIIGALVDSI
jgi:hypothetical protein